MDNLEKWVRATGARPGALRRSRLGWTVDMALVPAGMAEWLRRRTGGHLVAGHLVGKTKPAAAGRRAGSLGKSKRAP